MTNSSELGSKYKEYRSRYYFQRKWQAKLYVLNLLGTGNPKCACCGLTSIHNLTLDHVQPIKKESNKNRDYRFYEKLILENNLINLQILCFGCNASKNMYDKCIIKH